MMVKGETLIDATIIKAQARRSQSEAGARSETDPDAAWTWKRKKTHFGYKMRIGMDAGSGLPLRHPPLAPRAPSPLRCPYDPLRSNPTADRAPPPPAERLHLAPFRPQLAPFRPQNSPKTAPSPAGAQE